MQWCFARVPLCNGYHKYLINAKKTESVQWEIQEQSVPVCHKLAVDLLPFWPCFFIPLTMLMATDVVLIILFVVQYHYLDWEFYHKNCNTLQGDREYVYFWEKLSSKTKVRVM